MSFIEEGRERPERKYTPSAEKVVPEEADHPNARDNANLFVDKLYSEMDDSERGPYALVPTAGDIADRYQKLAGGNYWRYFPESLFSLREAYGAAKRKLLFQKELAAEWGPRGTGNMQMKNMGDMYILMTAIELALPEDQRPDEAEVL